MDTSKVPPAASRAINFDQDVRPILAASCYSCHGETKQKGGLRLDLKALALQGGDSGPAIVAGNGAGSILVQYVARLDPDNIMPKKGDPLTAEQVGTLRAWIDQGARWPETPGAVAVKDKSDHWAFKPMVEPALPKVNDPAWVRNPIDQFVLAKLEEKGLAPAPPADRPTLLRRVYFDLTGLPPTPEEVAAFVADGSPDAYEKVVDRLLASPHYGERWARHWMDVVHFAETHGNDQDRERPHAWPYRDYLIRAFNNDTPYARFIEEQVAGDVLYPDDPDATVATGFIAAGPWDESSQLDVRDETIDKKVAQNLDRDDMVTTTMSTFVSATVHCARCHDHKFDPITQSDYYGLQAVFAGVDRADRAYDVDSQTHQRRALLMRQKAGLESADLKRKIDRDVKALPAPQLVYAAARDFTPKQNFKPAGTPRPVFVLQRGDMSKPLGAAVPGALGCVPGLSARFTLTDPTDEGSRRAALAKWISNPANCLTWRSIVNRVWHYHFGHGIVATPNDFGHMGAMPTHPELLDWLALWLLDHGGSIKQLHRLILTSNAYRQSTRNNADFAKIDSTNQFLWRMNRSRLDAECVRDSILQVTGLLDPKMGGPSVKQFVEKPGIHVTKVADYDAFDVDSPDARRLSIYRFIFRTVPDPFMDAMDCPDASQLAPVRNTSVTALQAMAMWNDRFVVRYSEHLAERAARDAADLDGHIRLVYRLCLGREPTAGEMQALSAYANKFGMANLCRVVFNSNEFLFVN